MTHNGHPASHPIAGALPGMLPPGTASAQNADQPPGDDTPTVVPPPRRMPPPPLGSGHRRPHEQPPGRPQAQPTPPGGWPAPRQQPPVAHHRPAPVAGPRPPQHQQRPPHPHPQPAQPQPPQPQPPQAQPAQPVAPPAAPEMPPSRRLVTFAVAVVMVAALAVAGWFVVRPTSRALPAAVGECVAETGPNTIKAVGCADASAKYRVIAQLDNRPIADAKQSACAAHPKTAVSFWQGDADRPGTVLCLESVKPS